MGELLRAVMDQAAISSDPMFYTCRFQNTTNVGVNVMVAQSATLRMKTDCYFLMTAYAAFARSSTARFIGLGLGTFQLVRANTGKPFNNVGFQRPGNVNWTLNQLFTLPEYVLFEPNETLVVNALAHANEGGVDQWQNFIVLHGIEYAMPR